MRLVHRWTWRPLMWRPLMWRPLMWRPAVLGCVISVIISMILPAPSLASEAAGLPESGDLGAGSYASAGGVALESLKARYTSSIGGLNAPEGSYFVVIEAVVRSAGRLDPVIPRDNMKIRLEDGPQSIPGWDMDEGATGAAERAASQEPSFWDTPLARGSQGRMFAAFVVPVGTKDIWYHLMSGYTQEKGYTGGMRSKIGDLPGDEAVRPAGGEYVVVIGSFWVKDNAMRWAAEARRREFSAFVAEATAPRGMYVAAVRSAINRGEAVYFLDLARERGYTDAFIMSPLRPRKGAE